MKKLRIESLIADRMSVGGMIHQLRDDPLGQMSLSARLRDIESELAKVTQAHQSGASVALLFSGGPVFGSRAISADFTTKVLGSFQSLVEKKMAFQHFGSIGDRGPVSATHSANLAITELVRGSMGFVLEECGRQDELVDTVAKEIVHESAKLIASASAPDIEEFEEAIQDVDHRILGSLRDFFYAMDDAHATVRIVEDDFDATIDNEGIARGRLRTDATEIEERESEDVIAELLGVLPSSRWFEIRVRGATEVIKGHVSPGFVKSYESLKAAGDKHLLGGFWRIKLRTREVKQRNKPPKFHYTLLGLIESIDHES